MTKSKRTALEKECIKFDIVHILEQYKSKLSMRYKNPKIHHLARLVYSDYLRFAKSAPHGNTRICHCVTCRTTLEWNNQHCHPGHFRTAGTSLKYKFEDNNVHIQCSRCNVMLNGNYQRYTLFMIDKYGEDYTRHLLDDNEVIQIKNYQYAEMILGRYECIKYVI